jgi:hypothetical protein
VHFGEGDGPVDQSYKLRVRQAGLGEPGQRLAPRSGARTKLAAGNQKRLDAGQHARRGSVRNNAAQQRHNAKGALPPVRLRYKGHAGGQGDAKRVGGEPPVGQGFRVRAQRVRQPPLGARASGHRREQQLRA